jgi:hypothetical protein
MKEYALPNLKVIHSEELYIFQQEAIPLFIADFEDT